MDSNTKNKSFYRANTLKRPRRTNAQLDQLDEQILAVLKINHPQSVRHIFYRKTDPRLPESVKKSDIGYQYIQGRWVKLRRSGRILYAWIADMSRRGYFVNTFSNANEFIQRMAGLYRANLWTDSDYQCEIWCESRSIASVIQNDCNELAVDLYPKSGFASLSTVHYAVEQRNESDDDRPLIIFYIGAYDPAGVIINVKFEKELRLHHKDNINMQFVRLGVNEGQIKHYDLPTKPRDIRSNHVEATVEAESMPAHILQDLLRNHIESLLPPGALHAEKIAEQSERKGLRILARYLNDGRLA